MWEIVPTTWSGRLFQTWEAVWTKLLSSWRVLKMSFECTHWEQWLSMILCGGFPDHHIDLMMMVMMMIMMIMMMMMMMMMILYIPWTTHLYAFPVQLLWLCHWRWHENCRKQNSINVIKKRFLKYSYKYKCCCSITSIHATLIDGTRCFIWQYILFLNIWLCFKYLFLIIWMLNVVFPINCSTII